MEETRLPKQVMEYMYLWENEEEGNPKQHEKWKYEKL